MRVYSVLRATVRATIYEFNYFGQYARSEYTSSSRFVNQLIASVRGIPIFVSNLASSGSALLVANQQPAFVRGMPIFVSNLASRISALRV